MPGLAPSPLPSPPLGARENDARLWSNSKLYVAETIFSTEQETDCVFEGTGAELFDNQIFMVHV